MKGDFKNFIKILRKIKLSEIEKDILRSKISEFISYNPIRGQIKIPKQKNYISIFSVGHFVKATAFILIIAIVSGGYGVSYAASNSLPGEKLYTVKINVNEKIEEGLALTPEAKVLVQSKKVERRLEETQVLVKENKLSEDNKKIVEEKLEEHVEDLTKEIEILKKDGDVEVVLETTSKLTPVLEAHKDILKKKKEKNSDSNTESIIAKVEDTIKVVENEEISILANVTDDSSNEDNQDEIESVSLMTAVTSDDSSTKEENQATEKEETGTELENQTESIAKNRIQKAIENVEKIKKETSQKQELPIEDSKVVVETENKVIEETMVETKVETKKVVETLEKIQEIEKPENKVENILVGKIETTEQKEEVVYQATETSIENVIENTQEIPSLEQLNLTSDFDVNKKLVEAEDLIKKAQEAFEMKKFKEALELSQKANKITNEIEIYRKLNNLELSKAENQLDVENVASPAKVM